MCISLYIHTVIKHNNICIYIYIYIISSNIYYATTCFGPVCRPSSGCLENLSYYTMRVVPFCGGGRDLALQHESWKVATIETNILRGYISCTYLKNTLPECQIFKICTIDVTP